jgi:hypothetical protein
MTQLTRRQLLAAAGAAGVGTGLAGAGLARATARDPPYTRYTYAAPGDTDERRLRVAWYETYTTDGTRTFVESTNSSGETDRTAVFDPASDPTYVNDPGPVVSLPNALPGDSGVLVVGLEAQPVDTDDEGVDIWLQIATTENAENGVNEPESLAAGEDDPIGPGSGDADSGELADALDVRVWKDGGFMTGCDGAYDPLSETSLANDSLAAVSATGPLADGELVVECLPQGSARCVGFRWELPEGMGNHIQGDSVSFDLRFHGHPCESENPYDTPTPTETGGSA